MNLKSMFLSHVGCLRSENQDNYADIAHKGVFAVADGMGGHSDGAKASSLAVKAFSYQADHTTSQTEDYIRRAHQMISQATREQYKQQIRDMGTTAVVVYIDSQQMNYSVSWCGDSRLYHYVAAEDQIVQVTKDHSKVQELVDAGVLSEDDACFHPEKNILTHAVGIGEESNLGVGTKKRKISFNDILILCTDGLSNEVDTHQILKLCRLHSDPNTLAEELVIGALDHGGRDNVTVAVIHIEPDEYDLY